MMTYSEIKITFNEDVPINGVVSFYSGNENSGNRIYEKWKSLRTNIKEVTKGVDTIVPGERSAIDYVTSFNLDYNSAQFFEVTRNVNVVVIKSYFSEVSFSDGKAETTVIVKNPPSTNVTTYNVDFEYNNFDANNILKLNDLSFVESLNACKNVQLQLTTSVVVQNIQGGSVNITGNTQNPILIELLRGSKGVLSLSLSTNEGQSLNVSTLIPSVLNIGSVSVTDFPNGADIEVNVSNDTLLDVEHSIDNVNWKSDNKFTGLASGNYTAYVRDQFGCTTQKSFTISSTNLSKPYAYFSKSNSLRFVLRKENGESTSRLIDENAFACEDFAQVNHPIVQKYLNNDFIVSQYKTNYANHSVKIIDNNGLETLLVPEQKTNNIGLKDRREAVIYNYGVGKTGVYFTTGKILDYTTGADTGDTYVLNGGLPEWAKVGQFVNTSFGWLEIKTIIPSNEKNAEVLIFDYEYTGNEEFTTVSAVYNREDYNVFEFGIDCLLFDDRTFKIHIELSDSNFGTLTYESETIETTKVLESNFAEIKYRNDTNTDVFYNTGIEFLLRLPIDSVKDNPTGDSETHKTDTTAILLNGEANEEKEFKFLPIPRALVLKLFYALMHRELIVNGVQYVVSETPETPERLGDSNLYVLTARLVKANEQYKSKSNNNSLPTLSGITELPSYLSTGNGFLKI